MSNTKRTKQTHAGSIDNSTDAQRTSPNHTTSATADHDNTTNATFIYSHTMAATQRTQHTIRLSNDDNSCSEFDCINDDKTQTHIHLFKHCVNISQITR